MTEVDVVRVFADEHGRHGNALGVVLDPAGLSQADQQAIAAELGYSETVFVEDVGSARLRIYTPAVELPLAGHPLVGVSWLLARETGRAQDFLRPVLLAEPVPTFVEDGATWVRATVADAPPWDHLRLAEAAEVEAADPATADEKVQMWAWLDERAGVVRARVFARAFGVAEDEACGSATLMLAAQLGRPITVRHGEGSVVLARPAGPGLGEVGGRVVYDMRRAL
ncbi:PhzF family phenazine biosynthesis protein [Actinokineospora iranica]|uniref:Phenazine biosynthesis protein PhzF family n=1 Tax=Actinokineospora iranica TaxID=1271860 RepID=A0A1G6QXZ5_9PSEU|nr:PhzF family phenazine biosynthesis protein [Actinokineospora iranica]SDC97063.1 phenazine biosynthesis protein PhzF family [Actinokineospora iranica]